MTEERLPAEVFSLSEHICDELVARGWTTADLARRMYPDTYGLREQLMVDLLVCVSKESLRLHDEDFDGLSRAFGMSPDYFRGLYAVWEKHPDRRSPFEPPECVFGPESDAVHEQIIVPALERQAGLKTQRRKYKTRTQARP